MNEQAKPTPTSSSPNWTLVAVAIAIIVIFLMAVVGSQMLMRTAADVTTLKTNYNELAEKLGLGNGKSTEKATNKIALVDTARIFRDYKGSGAAAEQFKQEQEKGRKALEQLQKDLEAGRISSVDFSQRQAKLLSDLQNLDLQLSAPIQRKMIEITREIGRTRNYLMVFNNQEGNLAVLYAKENEIEDITDEVLTKMNQEP
jgi:Skp family chaperone for outer membrane proteins